MVCSIGCRRCVRRNFTDR
ncbi:hypothetical protein D030_1814A, partial [Vibrio parahaemolyticus AQ3810]